MWTKLHTAKKKIGPFTSGAFTFASLLITLISGVIVAFRYNPSKPFQSVRELSFLIPYGDLFRALHYYAAQLFIISLLVHLFLSIFEKRYSYFKGKKWFKLIFLIIVSFLLNLTGFILRGDAEAIAAASIFSKLLKFFPLIGEFLNSLFFYPTHYSLVFLYFDHIFILTGLVIYLSWVHISRFSDNFRLFLLIGTIGLLFSLFVPAPLSYSPEILVRHNLGPWYFVGLQETFRYLPVWFAGYIMPLIFFALLFSFPYLKREKLIHIIVFFTWLFLLFYFFMTIKGYYRYLEGVLH